MSAVDPRHPDRDLIGLSTAALRWWARQEITTPTSSVTGGGAVAAVERAVSVLVEDRPALALPSATYGLRTALLAIGVHPADEVLVSELDWPAAAVAVGSIGARAVPVEVDEETLTMSPAAAAAARTGGTAAVLVTHLHGVCADVPAIRAALGDGLPVVEDAAQAFGAELAGRPAGALGDVAVFSFAGKVVDAGELAVLTARDHTVIDSAVRFSQHPVRQRLHGITRPEVGALTGRPAPLSAVVGAYLLDGWPGRAAALRKDAARLPDPDASGVAPLAVPPRRAAVPGQIPVRVPMGWTPAPGTHARRSTARALPGVAARRAGTLRALTERVRILDVTCGADR